MNISSIKSTPVGYSQLMSIPNPNNENLDSCANMLLDVVKNFPALKTDLQSSLKLTNLVDNVFSKKDHLSLEKQDAISDLFYDVHGLNPSRDEHMMELE